MVLSKFYKAACVLGIAALCTFSLAACSGTSQNGLTGGVAATVNGVEIPEDKITTFIQSYRTSAGYESEEDWGTWLAAVGYTPESVRSEIVDSYVKQALIRQAAEQHNIVIESSEIDGYVAEVKANYKTEEAWQAALKKASTTEADYRETIELSLMQKRLQEAIYQPTDAEIVAYAQENIATYNNARRSSHILFKATDQETAQKVLAQINAGEIDFAEAATQYSQDPGSASKGGDIGWDKLSSLITIYTDALGTLQKGQVSGLVTSEYGIHIIKCTDMFMADGSITDINQLPSEFVDAIKSTLQTNNASTAFTTWFDEFKSKAEIVVNDMPSNVPYNVDMSRFTSSSTSEEAVTGEQSDSATSTEDGTSSSSGAQ